MCTQSLGAMAGLLAMKLSAAMGQDDVLAHVVSKLGALHNPFEFRRILSICHWILVCKGRQSESTWKGFVHAFFR